MNFAGHEQLLNAIIAEGVNPQVAARLVDEAPEVCRRQLSYLDYQDEGGDRAETLVASIDGDWPEPARLYWHNIAQRHQDGGGEKDEPAPAEAAPTGTQHSSSIDNGWLSEEASQDSIAQESHVADITNDEETKLLAALERIAAMRHAHRDGRDGACPVCMAWDALKEWDHRQWERQDRETQ